MWHSTDFKKMGKVLQTGGKEKKIIVEQENLTLSSARISITDRPIGLSFIWILLSLLQIQNTMRIR